MENLKIEEIDVQQVNQFGSEYIQHFDKVSSFFHYSPFDPQEYQLRVDELYSRPFNRQGVAAVIRGFHEKWGITPAIETQLARLEEENSVVVIGGQQAGLLLGPLYSFHKAISIIQLARQKEKELGVPVIPIFWIAGEDHDLLEVNHTYLPKADSPQLEKHILQDLNSSLKQSMSHRKLPTTETKEWVKAFFEHQLETEYTNQLLQAMVEMVERSETYVDFFAQCLHYLFSEHGLLFIDSGSQDFRRLQSKPLSAIIQSYDLIHEEVKQSILKMKEEGYKPQVEIGENPALLFIYEEGERLLLEKIGTGFVTKNGEYHYTEEELLALVEREPWKFSNNVITRPFIQESMFPTLAFIGGPGEIAYWALYKTYFEKMSLRFPILAPRISITFIEPAIQRILEKRDIPIEIVFGQLKSYKQQWLKQQDDLNLEESFTQVKGKITEIYQPLIDKLGQIQKGLKDLGEQNIQKIMEQVEFLEKRSQAAFTSQHEAAIRQFDKVEQSLFPLDKLQERVHNPFTFLNKHGMVLVDILIDTPLEINGRHKLIYI